MRKVLVIGGSMLYGERLRQKFDVFVADKVHKNILDLVPTMDLVVFTGGQDVSPKLYNEHPHHRTGGVGSIRDEEEKELFVEAWEYDIPMLGICRGAQFLTVMSGGALIQDVTAHNLEHAITYKKADGEEDQITVTSTHHQMMYPFDMGEEHYELIGWCANPISQHHQHMSLTSQPKQVLSYTVPVEPEIVHYPETNCLCIQGHPEFTNAKKEFVDLTFDLIDRYCVKKET